MKHLNVYVSGCRDCPALYDEVCDYISSTAACCSLVKDETKPENDLRSGFRTLPSDDLRAPSVAPDWCPLRVHNVLLVLKDDEGTHT